MYIATVPNRSSPPAILIRESVREGNKVRTRTIANISSWSPERIEAMRFALKGKFDKLSAGATSAVATQQLKPECAEIFGTFFALKQLADETGITTALGHEAYSKYALFLVLSRIAHQGSRLSAVRFARQHAIKEILDLPAFDEDHLYEALDWLSDQQSVIETKLYKDYLKRAGKPPVLVLYDVTSSYFEGECNELAAYGYNRDGKHGKKQIVIGLLTDEQGEPLAVRVFKGNTADPSTVAEQIKILKKQFEIKDVIFVGDRGMVKARGKQALNEQQFSYISALTDAQVRTMLKKEILQIDMFDTPLTEVEHDSKRYILRRNNEVQKKERKRVEDKLQQLNERIAKRNAMVATSKRADATKGLVNLQQWVKRHRLHTFASLSLKDQTIQLTLNDNAREDDALLDGCYVLETDVSKEILNAEKINQCYCNLQRVEHDFRTLKTDFLEIRPIFVRKASRTQGHVFVAMLALKITRLFEEKLHEVFGTTQEDLYTTTRDDALAALSRLIFLRYNVNGKTELRLPEPDQQQRKILKALGIKLPKQCRQ